MEIIEKYKNYGVFRFDLTPVHSTTENVEGVVYLDLDIEIVVEHRGDSINPHRFVQAIAADKGTSNRLKRTIASLFKEDCDYVNLKGESVADIIIHKFLLDNSAKTGVELKHLKDAVDALSPTTFMSLND